MAKEPDNIVEVERQLALLEKTNYSKTKRILLSTPALVIGLAWSLYTAVLGSYLYMAIGILILVAGAWGVTAAFYQPAAVARRIAYLEELGESMEVDSTATAIETGAPHATSDVNDSRTCPFCAETIKAAALVCKHCGRDLPRSGNSSIRTREQARIELKNPTDPQNQFGLAALITGIVSLFLPIPFVAGAAAVVLGFIGHHKVDTLKANNKWMAVVGIWLGLLSIVSWFFIVFYFFIL